MASAGREPRLATPGPATFGGPAVSQKYKVRQSVPFWKEKFKHFLSRGAPWKCLGPLRECSPGPRCGSRQDCPKIMFWGVLTPKPYFLLSRPPKGTSLRRNTRFEPSLVVICPTVWSGRDAKSTKKKEPKVSQNSPFSQTPFPSSHINQVLDAGSYPAYLSWFWLSERSVGKCRSSGGSNLWLSQWLGTSLLQQVVAIAQAVMNQRDVT